MGEPVTEPQPTDKPALPKKPVLPEKIEIFIGGRHVPSASGRTFGVADPVSNLVYARAAAGDADDIARGSSLLSGRLALIRPSPVAPLRARRAARRT